MVLPCSSYLPGTCGKKGSEQPLKKGKEDQCECGGKKRKWLGCVAHATQGKTLPGVLGFYHGGQYRTNRKEPTLWSVLSIDALK